MAILAEGKNINITIHRGTQEIGGSCVEVAAGATRIIVDLGLPLVAPWNKAEKLESAGLNRKTAKELLAKGILPDVKGLYAADGGGPDVTAVLLSHPHQDHYGLLGHIRPSIPVYLSDGARRIIDASDIFLPTKAHIQKPVILEDRKPVQIGDLRVTAYLVDHSGFGAMAFLLEGDGKKVFYSGDFRAHGRKWKLFPKFLRTCPKDVDCLLMEGTTLGRPGRTMETEDQIEQRIVAIAKGHIGVKLVYASGQNIDRLVTFYRAAIKTGGHFVVDLYAAYILDTLGVGSIPKPAAPWKGLKVFYTKYLMRKLAREGRKDLFAKYRPFEITASEIARDPGKVFLLYRSSLAEDVEKIGNFKDSAFIYSLYAGYRHESSFVPVKEFLDKHGIAMETAHTSGHAGFDDLKRLVLALKPKFLIPMHTFNPERYAELWPSVRTLKDGEPCPV